MERRSGESSAAVGTRAGVGMNEPEIKDAETVEPAPERPALPPPPSYRAPDMVAPASAFDRLLSWIEQQPLIAAGAMFALLTVIHVLILNVAGVATGLYVGDTFVLAAGATPVEIVLLAFIAYNVVLPTLLSRACIKSFDDLRPAFALNDHQFGQTRASLLDPFYGIRLMAGLFWAVLLTPVFGSLLRSAIPGQSTAIALLTIWMYVRIALTFGLLGASIGYIVMLHHRFRAATGEYLKVDLFDATALRPIATYARQVALHLIILLALAGPAVAQPDAMFASTVMFALGVLLAVAAVVGAMWGARRAIRAAKKAALGELHAYTRELWRRAYAGSRLTEAVAIPALGAMLTVRNEIQRLPDWPGGWGVFARLAALAAIPVASWFGGQLAAQVMDAFAR